jgi:hypothetical protein
MSRGPQAGKPPQVPWGLAGEREENEAELGVVFGPNPGAIVHFSTSSLTRPPKRIAARAASQRLPRPFGPRQPRLVAKLRNFPENFGRHTALRMRPSIRPAAVLIGSVEGLSGTPSGRFAGRGMAISTNSENTAFRSMPSRVDAANSKRSRRPSRVAFTLESVLWAAHAPGE